jgi:hypothetical protein
VLPEKGPEPLTTHFSSFAFEALMKMLGLQSENCKILTYQASTRVFYKVVDPDPDSATLWIRIRIGNPDPGARKKRNFSGKCTF